jgi:glycosyltransferase involved in cell wall biosynthesis
MSKLIAYFATRDEIGGAQKHILELIKNSTHQSILIVGHSAEPFLSKFAVNHGCKVRILKNLRPNFHPILDFVTFLELLWILVSLKPVLLHAHSSKAGILGRLAACLIKIPVIFTVHGWSFGEEKRTIKFLIFRTIERLLAYLTAQIICVSFADYEKATRNSIKANIAVIHNGIEDLKLGKKINQDNFTIVMVARFENQKDHATIIKAFAKCDHTARLILIGDGPNLPDAKNLVEKFMISDRVSFHSTVTDVVPFLNIASVFVLTTFWESLPISIIEAMRAGLPVIATNVGGVKELVINHVNGYTINIQDSASLFKHLVTLSQSLSLHTLMGRESRRLFEEKFTSKVMLEKTFTLYQEVFKKRWGEK